MGVAASGHQKFPAMGHVARQVKGSTPFLGLIEYVPGIGFVIAYSIRMAFYLVKHVMALATKLVHADTRLDAQRAASMGIGKAAVALESSEPQDSRTTSSVGHWIRIGWRRPISARAPTGDTIWL